VVCRSESNPGLIAFVLPTFECAGAQRDVILLANALIKMGVSVTILVLRDGGPLRSMVDPEIRIVEIPGRRIRYAIPGLRQTIRDIAPRYLLSSGPNLNLCCLAAVRSLPRRDQPKVILREVNTPSYSEKLDPRWQDRIAYRLLHVFYRNADRVVTLTDGARRELVTQFSIPAAKVAVMRSNAVITPEHSDQIANWDGEQGREPDLIVSIGRLSPEKDHLLLLRALSLLGKRRPWRLVIVGDGDERAALEEFVQANGLANQTTFAGFVSDPFPWIMRANVAVVSSVYEGLCNVIIEALGCGTPVVSTDCPYGPREILQHGRFGRLVPVGDAAALASAIEAALDSPVDRASLIGRSQDYTADRAAANFLEIVSAI
jgi:glycosyltransferase involved in cell wall biosynthesis